MFRTGVGVVAGFFTADAAAFFSFLVAFNAANKSKVIGSFFLTFLEVSAETSPDSFSCNFTLVSAPMDGLKDTPQRIWSKISHIMSLLRKTKLSKIMTYLSSASGCFVVLRIEL